MGATGGSGPLYHNPAYNEVGRIARTLQRIDDYLRGRPFSCEIMVVLDGPTDNTLGVLREFAEKVPNLND